ncbi:seizure protein 6 homolog isoform X2 [Mobula hypostoma]|uniref:seizure protein 6 homolog isoform X2 n=1 Tax=Mobula hypostoma TaxID=723540 RepID=UPI002FC3AE93
MAGAALFCVAGLLANSLFLPRSLGTWNVTYVDLPLVDEVTARTEEVSESLGQLIHNSLLTKHFEDDQKLLTGTGETPRQPGSATPTNPLTPLSFTPPAWGQGPSAPPTGGEEETTTTLITTTTVTTVQTPVLCNMNVMEAEGMIESLEYSGSPLYSGLDCSYVISVYTGYGVELEVEVLNLLAGELLTVEGLQDDGPLLLANEALMSEGQSIRTQSRQVLVHFQSPHSAYPGAFRFRCRAYPLSCALPVRPAYGQLWVSGLRPGAVSTFRCDPGFQMQGAAAIRCLNLTRPQWSGPEPHCMAICRATIHNATVGHILSPAPGSTHSPNLTCHWLIQAPPAHRLHLHFERLSLDEDTDRLIIRNGIAPGAPAIFHSDIDDIPEGGIVSDSREIFVELVSENSALPLVLALRYEAFERDHCYEPFVAHGNFTSNIPLFEVGSIVTFSCLPGYALEQGAGAIECIDPQDPHWNSSEPICRATCGGDMSEVSGVIFSPEWPEVYGRNQDCVWTLHVREDRRMVIDVEILNIRRNDILSVFDGPDLNSRVLGQYLGQRQRFKLFSTSCHATIQFQSDSRQPALGETQGFIIHFAEMLRNDTCPTLGPIPHGWKSLSHSSLVRGTVVTYQCEPGYDIVGADILMCQWDLSWSNPPPTCQKVLSCPDPGDVPHGLRLTPGLRFPVGSRVQYACEEGHSMEGSATLTCLGRNALRPKWSAPPPTCVLTHQPCLNPGVPDNGYLTLYKQHYRAGEILHFFCYEGFELVGQASITCLSGRPSHWSSPSPFCKVTYEGLYDAHNLQVSKASGPAHQVVGGHIVLAIILPIILVILLIGGIYLYYTRFQGKSFFRNPLSKSHSYSPITVESDFNNPLFEAGETREYEVSI